MAMGKVGKVGLVAAAIAGLGVAALAACGFEPPPKNTSTGGGGSGPGGPCKADPGELPEPNCDNSDNECTGSGCAIDEAQCGAVASCLPTGDNAGKPVADLRIRSLIVSAPPPLASRLVQRAIITANIDLNARQCGERGNGAFNWLIRVDRERNLVTTGGAPPTNDPFGLGYCFYNHTTADGIEVTPQEIPVTFDGDTFTSEPIPKLRVPIFLNGDVNNVIVLPITNAVVSRVTMSDGDNCIGKFDLAALGSDCADEPSTCAKWKTAGAIGGYITIAEADDVNIADLNQSLCVLLTGATKGPDGRCPRDESGELAIPEERRGDFCSTTQSAGGCRDAFWLAATFAASAAVIHEGGSVPECQGGGSSVRDSGTPEPDAGEDASTDAASEAGE